MQNFSLKNVKHSIEIVAMYPSVLYYAYNIRCAYDCSFAFVCLHVSSM